MRANKVTFATVAPLFMEEKIRNGLRLHTITHWKSYLITGYYLKPLHNLPIDEITTEQIQTQIDRTITQSGNIAARNCCTALRVFFKWARKKKKLPVGHPDPMTDVESPQQNKARERVLTDDEIRLIWKTCEAWLAKAIHDQQTKITPTGRRVGKGQITSPDFPRATMLLFETGCRAQEIGELQWSGVDLDNAELFIPGSRRKSRKSKEQQMDLCVPLTNTAVQILRSIERRPGSNYVFGYTNHDGRNLSNNKKQINKRIIKAGGTPPENWRPHDIRRTFRTRLAALKVSRDVAEKLVGHIGHRNENERTYNRHEYWAEMRTALAMWETELRAIIAGTAKKVARPNFGERKKEDTA